MTAVFLHRLDRWIREAAPLAISLMVVIATVMPVRVPDYAFLAPGFVLMAVFYWTVHRPDLMRPWGAFLVGLFDDVLTGAPLGLNALVFVLMHGAIVAQHRFFRDKPFVLVWFAFAIVAFGAIVASALFAFIAQGAPIDPGSILVRYGLTVAMYPLAGWFLGRAQRAFLPAV
jgi:rod shape-determining protein MreD